MSKENIHSLQQLVNATKDLSVQEKKAFLEQRFSLDGVSFKEDAFNSIQCVIFYSLIAIGQADHLYPSELKNWNLGSAKVSGFDLSLEPKSNSSTHLGILAPSLLSLLNQLVPVEEFYDTIGGILGYQLLVLKLMQEEPVEQKQVTYHMPPCIDLTTPSTCIRQIVLDGIASMPQFAELYPVGGAGDRLDLKDEQNLEALPVAKLNFLGQTLLEGLVVDLQAREWLYYHLHEKQLNVPIVMMSSEEKHNTTHIMNICESCHWFCRPRSSFIFLSQPQVPVVTSCGLWANEAPLKPILKPGGHGVIWKLLLDHGILDALLSQGIAHLLIRQINNPLAGLDTNMLALAGYGAKQRKSFGFSACERRLDAAEGMDILVEEKTSDGYYYSIRNIEYPQFSKMGLKQCLDYPSNVNLLYANIEAMKSEIHKNCIPGMLLNLKQEFSLVCANQSSKNLMGGRIESTMQNIADGLSVHAKERIQDVQELDLRSFVMCNRRQKIISVTKKSHLVQEDINETPVGAFYDLMNNFREILQNHCLFELPDTQSVKDYIKNGPSLMLYLHPALGPLWDIIGQKMRGGKLWLGSELQIHCAEVDVHQLHLQGSLIIRAHQPMGHLNDEGILIYSKQCGKIELNDVSVCNLGRGTKMNAGYCKNQIEREEVLEIVLEGNAEFSASSVKIEGARKIVVPQGYRLEIDPSGERLVAIIGASWFWKMHVKSDQKIVLEKKTVMPK